MAWRQRSDEPDGPQSRNLDWCGGRKANARWLLDAWRSVVDRGITVEVNELGHPWFTARGKRIFLAVVGSGFAWPSDGQGDGDDG